MAPDFIPQASSFDWAVIAATISILLGGILFGAGIAFRYARLRLLGQEELAQGIISAAMVGGIVAFCAVLNAAALAAMPSGATPHCPNSQAAATTPSGLYECNLEALSGTYGGLSASLLRSSVITGFASSLKITDGNVTAQPFFALEEASRSLSAESRNANGISALSELELALAGMIRASALVLFLPVGLLLRTFFATRKLGAAAMAAAVAAFMVYPLLFLHTFPASSSPAVAKNATTLADGFNAAYAAIPAVRLNDTASVQSQMEGISGGEFEARLQPVLSASADANALAVADLVVFPLVSLAVSAVAAFEFYRIFSARVFVPYLDEI
ncbi:MAG: hypothetical protein WCT52_03620 [Candidatus Micrarchaeia archaeon]|jgi:hypothetical protein